MIFEFDDFGATHQISDQCQSYDCRDALTKLKEINPNFKVTLFAIPGEITPELLKWKRENYTWVEFAVHGVYHSSNYECEKMNYDDFDMWMQHSSLRRILNEFTHGFRAPGWQISDDIYRWLSDHGWWVADQQYNDRRRPKELPAYVNSNGHFGVYKGDGQQQAEVNAHHGHVWNTCGNGIYEQFDYLSELVKNTEDFKFVSELFA